jgi:iron(III) transport system substrate-binding protein
MKRVIPFFTAVALVLTPLLASAAGEVNLYSARNEQLIKPLLDKFTEETGISVNLVTGKADALLKRLETEGRNTPADLLITTDAGRLHRAKEAGVLQPVTSAMPHEAIPANLRDPEGYWFGLSQRARPVFYVKGKVDPSELSNYEELANEKWKGRICIRSSDNIYNQSLVASMIANDGEQQAEQWASGFVANFARPPKGGDRDQIKAAAAGQCDIAIANTYYVGAMLSGNDEEQKAAAGKMGLFWPNQEGRGAHVNVSGIGMTAAARNSENAKKLMEFLAGEEAQLWYAEVNNEYPVREGVAWSDILKSWGEFKADSLNLSRLGELNGDAVRLMDRAGWK